ncbi:hypothetical protein GMMP15_1340001 [Candidatus Magnetomoraceae bacterium gMMP-15]
MDRHIQRYHILFIIIILPIVFIKNIKQLNFKHTLNGLLWVEGLGLRTQQQYQSIAGLHF